MARQTPHHTVLLILGCLVCLLLMGIFAWPYVDHFLLTGRFFPVDVIESLSDPVTVLDAAGDDLLLQDGRRVTVPLLYRLSFAHVAFQEITKRGVEVDADGLAIGLVRVHHWCGNDPVRDHLARINLGDLLRYFAEREGNASNYDNKSLNFSSAGLDVTEYFGFKSWIRSRARR